MADKPNSTVNFRKLLLNRCQKEFERDKVDDDVFEKKQRELESASSVMTSLRDHTVFVWTELGSRLIYQFNDLPGIGLMIRWDTLAICLHMLSLQQCF